MMGQPSDIPQCRLTCAKQWLKKAIDLYEINIKNPKTETEESQMEMMNQMKKAYDCIAVTSCGVSGTTLK
jgi:diketogulonate reductase-like aldo/keto reductase